jgi:hypothetical protein
MKPYRPVYEAIESFSVPPPTRLAPIAVAAADIASVTAAAAAAAAEGAETHEPIVVEDYDSVDALAALGAVRLKNELSLRRLKAGGDLRERASRLFAVRGLKPDEIDKKLKATKNPN